MSETIDRINLRTMTAPDVVAHYARPWSLSAAEQAAFDRVAPLAKDRPILDIGVGGGRTVAALRDISHDYIGVDYSREMVDACRRRYPDARFAFADARAMDAIADDSIFLAVFSCNGIGMVSHADRLSILREVERVLQPGGLFVFSTHNRDSAEFSRGFRMPDFQWAANPARLLVRAARYASETWLRLRNRMRHRPHEVHTEDYAVINDVCHHYGTMLYYLTLGKQREQLVDAGFEPDAEAYDLRGERLEGDTRDDSILLVARKRAQPAEPSPAPAPRVAIA